MEINASEIISRKDVEVPKKEIPMVINNINNEINSVSTFHSASLIIEKCLERDFDIEKLEKLLEIKGKFEAEESRKLFQKKFVEMQSELPEIPKTKQVMTSSGKIAYSYAPLDAIVKTIKPTLRKFQFSYSWSEGSADKSELRRIYCHIHGYGHTETNFVDFPPPATNNLTNLAQTYGMASTYGKRYSLCEALGIITEDDTDANEVNGLLQNRNNAIDEKKELIFELVKLRTDLQAKGYQFDEKQIAYLNSNESEKANIADIKKAISKLKNIKI